MNQEALKLANISNLTSLWRKMEELQVSQRDSAFLNRLPHWPNRSWIDLNTKESSLLSSIQLIEQLSAKSIFPIWDVFPKNSEMFNTISLLEKKLIQQGFYCSFQQTAMVLNLSTAQEESKNIASANVDNIHPISSQKEIEVWTDIASQSFGYQVDINVIKRISTFEKVVLLMYYDNGQAAGVAMQYQTDNVMGVHQVGVLDTYRGKGIARKLMLYIMETSRREKIEYITLQASILGEPLYRSLGFSEQFTIRNYAYSK